VFTRACLSTLIVNYKDILFYFHF